MVILPTKQQEAAMQTYASVLQEIRGRAWLADTLMTGDKGVNSLYTKEFCYLQLNDLRIDCVGLPVTEISKKQAQKRFKRKSLQAI